jgi:hypothetical protein
MRMGGVGLTWLSRGPKVSMLVETRWSPPAVLDHLCHVVFRVQGSGFRVWVPGFRV